MNGNKNIFGRVIHWLIGIPNYRIQIVVQEGEKDGFVAQYKIWKFPVVDMSWFTSKSSCCSYNIPAPMPIDAVFNSFRHSHFTSVQCIKLHLQSSNFHFICSCSPCVLGCSQQLDRCFISSFLT